VVYQAGHQPDQTGNDHYQSAGRLHQSEMVEEISAEEAGPGALWQRFGEKGADQSHNAILTSFVDIKDVDRDYDHWRFTLLGAEQNRAAEAEKTPIMKKGTNENVSGKRYDSFVQRINGNVD